MYSFDSRIRYSETDSEGKLTLTSLLNYFQDASTFQSEDLDVGIAYMKKMHLVWVLSSWQIVVERYPRLGEKITAGTFPTEFKGFIGIRNFFMQGGDGTYLARANSVWSLLDADTGRPTHLTEKLLESYVMEEKLPMEYAPRKIAVPEGGSGREPVVVKLHHLDTNRHVNNGQYVAIAMEYLPQEFDIRQMRAEYKKQAFLEDILYPYVVKVQDGYVVALSDADRKPYAVVEFLGKESL